jgi:hypothetical protein
LATAAMALSLSCATLFAPSPAAAQEFTLHLEPALALWVDTPQSDRFGPGLYLAIRPGVALSRVFALQWSYAYLYTPAADGFVENGAAHMLSTGVRVRPFGAMADREDHLSGLFVDANLSYVNTEGLDRFGFDVGLGYALQVSPGFAIGLVARYNHIIQADESPNFNENDAQFVSLGLDFGFGPAPDEEARYTPTNECPECKQCPANPTAPACVEPVANGCPDYDKDGVCDPVDRCPTQPGPPSSWGCPTDPCKGPPIVVLVQFKYDSAELPVPRDDNPQTMDPVLDAVARAVAQDATCNVCIVGYASEEGPVAHNQTLSENRATAVQGYMTARGITKSRMPTTGLGARCQLIPSSSLELNRRVEFRRLKDGESCPTTCTQ